MPKKVFSNLNDKLLENEDHCFIYLFVCFCLFVASFVLPVQSALADTRNVRTEWELVRHAGSWTLKHTKSECAFFTGSPGVVSTY